MNWWHEVFPDPWVSRFPLQRNHFEDLEGSYEERPLSLWEGTFYSPLRKTKISPDRRKARVVKMLSPGAVDIPVCLETREDPNSIESHTKPKQVTSHSSDLKLSQLEEEKSVQVQPFSNEAVSEDSRDETLFEGIDEFAEEKGELKHHMSELSDDNDDPSPGNESDQAVKETSSRKSETRSAEDHKLQAIKTQLTKAKELVPRINKFKGSKDDKEFLYLEEHLMRLILALDLISADGLENVKFARKAAVTDVFNIIKDLEARVLDKSSYCDSPNENHATITVQ